MERKKNYQRKVAVISMFLMAIVFCGSCKKGDEASTNLTDSTSSDSSFSSSQAILAASTSSIAVNLSGLKSDGGYAYKLGYPISVSGDSNGSPTVSKLRLFENGVELKPPHSVHQDIRNSGKGRFSHWGTALYFSASDNTNPAKNGRKYTYTLDGSTGTAPATGTPTAPTAPSNGNTLPVGVNAGLLGYAMVNGTTTGGAGGQTVTVTTLSALKAAVGDNAAKVIYVSGAIKGSGNEYMYVKSNKSIIGKPGASIEGINFYMFTVSNIIIQDLRFKNYVTDAALQIKMSTHHIWVDHCEFSTDRTHGWEYWGKDIAITRESDFVTVSWCKFHDTNLSVLISGGIEGHEADKGKLHVTMHHNYWYNVGEREPTMNYGSVHMFNNYHLNNSGYSLGARAGGTVRTDNEYFSGCKKPISTSLAGDPPGYFSGVNTNIYSNCGSNSITTAISSWVPSYSYQGALNAAADVPNLVTQGSGPRAIH
jgi:pectate lyase